jgi:excisionase family DNA binding protein
MVEGKELLTAEETAQRLNITRRTVLKWARERKIERIKISGKVVLFTAEAIDRSLQSRTVDVKSETLNHERAGRTIASQTPAKKGGDRRTSGELWKDLRKEVRQCQ